MKTYQRIIAGVLVLAGFLGLYGGCDKKTDNKEIINKANQTTPVETIIKSDNQTSSIETIIESDDQTPPVETIISEHESLVNYLTPKLEKVKDGLYAELSKGELRVGEYWQKTSQLLFEEKIVYEMDKNFFYILSKLNSKLPIKRYKGVKNIYIGLEDIALSTEAQEDCDKYTKIKEMTYDYLKEELGNKPILISEFTTMVKNYLMNQDVQGFIGPERLVIDLIYNEENLKKEFNTIPYNPERSGGYPPEVLEEALDKL